ncbi:conserved hypothetical protein [Burkholderia vietnamiensis]|nr:conserved hypothetical protein [Burkholderia vietnamiensis]
MLWIFFDCLNCDVFWSRCDGMLNAIRMGDSTDHGGEVVEASPIMRINGRGVARKGDKIKCPIHPDVNPNVIEEGDPNIKDHGVPIARQGHLGTCGCRLISSLE